MTSNEVLVIYNSRDEQFKQPPGAVRAGDVLNIEILVSLSENIDHAKVAVICDRDGSTSFYDMREHRTDAETDDYSAWTADFRISDRGLYWYYFIIGNGENEKKIGRSGDNKAVLSGDPVSSWQQTVYSRDFDVPEWIKGGVFYHIFVDRFHRSGSEDVLPGKNLRTDWGGIPDYGQYSGGEILNNDFFGGDLAGIKEKLPYLEELGVTCIYLSPVFEAYSNHKYDTGDYMHIDPMFGTENDFQTLCADASERGIRIILDGVFSHTGADSLYFDKYGHYGGEGAWMNRDSKYRNWYYFHEGESYETWWGIDTLPRVRKEDPGYLDFICGERGVVRHWLSMGAAGWRLDVADELPNAFLTKLARSAKAEKHDAIIIGEVWEDASNKISYDQRKNYFEGNKLDSVMNYPFKNAIIDFIRDGNAQEIKETVELILEHYPDDVVNCLMNILGTHDTPRILTALAGDLLPDNASRQEKAEHRLTPEQREAGIAMLKIACVLQMTLPGVPCIYYGDEAETEGYADPFNRTCFPWGKENRELTEWYRKIISIRKNHNVYKQGRYRTAAAINGIYAFVRFDDDQEMMTAVNCGASEEIVIAGGQWKDLLTGKILSNNFTVIPGEILLLEKLQEENDGLQE